MSSHSERFRSRSGLLPPGFKFPGFQGLCMGGLDSSAYLSSAMGSPAVMVLTSNGDVTSHVQSQATFARQRMDKDGSNGGVTQAGQLSFPSPPFPVRPIFGQGDPYSSLSSPLLSLHHPLLAGHALGRSYISGGAFRPLSLQDERNGFHGSAFMPAKCMKLDSSSADLSPSLLLPYPGSEGSFQSPAASTGSSLHGGSTFLDGKDEDPCRDSDSLADGVDRLSETPNLSEESRSIERSTPEDRGTPKRHKSWNLDGQKPFCPICGQNLQLSELPSHFEMEVERLLAISKCISQQMESTTMRSPYSSPLNMNRKDEKGKPQSRWETYQRVKGNRTSRLTTRCVIKRKKWEEPISPTSTDRVHEEAAAAAHLMGLRKTQLLDHDASVDSRATAEFNWALTTRLHAFAQLQRGLTEYNVTRKIETTAEDENQELNVDGDDSSTYGQPHYTEADVITCSTEDNQDSKDQLKRIHNPESNSYQRISESGNWNNNNGGANVEGPEVTSTCASNNDTSGEFSSSDSPTKGNKENGESGKEHPEDGIKCLICTEPFIKPVVSICCWHVHCEECWLKTLGTKKLCPQCNMITSARDLRRIYL